jgi:hypothetical protein
MSFVTEWRDNYGDHDPGFCAETARPQRLVGGAALVCFAFACSYTLIVNLAGPRAGAIDISGTLPDRTDHVGARGDKLAVTHSPQHPPRSASDNDTLLFDPHFAMGASAGSFAEALPAQPGGWSVAAVPSKPVTLARQESASAPRSDPIAPSTAAPQLHPPQTRTAALRDGAHRAIANAVADTRTIFQKLFGKPDSATALAYADAETGSLGGERSVTSGLYDRSTAVYDISAHKVYLPDGAVLEAHSGLGSLLDDPHSADVRDRGVTPPAVYDLRPRESLFHGVQALRLIPEDESKALGRSGLLAHSFMLGPNGDSNGCVSFKDYDAFLQAYTDHEITRLAVVTRLD